MEEAWRLSIDFLATHGTNETNGKWSGGRVIELIEFGG
jgi:hypothetical protein